MALVPLRDFSHHILLWPVGAQRELAEGFPGSHQHSGRAGEPGPEALQKGSKSCHGTGQAKTPLWPPPSHHFQGGASGKESACQCRRHERCRFGPWVRQLPSALSIRPVSPIPEHYPFREHPWPSPSHDWASTLAGLSRLVLSSL